MGSQRSLVWVRSSTSAGYPSFLVKQNERMGSRLSGIKNTQNSPRWWHCRGKNLPDHKLLVQQLHWGVWANSARCIQRSQECWKKENWNWDARHIWRRTSWCKSKGLVQGYRRVYDLRSCKLTRVSGECYKMESRNSRYWAVKTNCSHSY